MAIQRNQVRQLSLLVLEYWLHDKLIKSDKLVEVHHELQEGYLEGFLFNQWVVIGFSGLVAGALLTGYTLVDSYSKNVFVSEPLCIQLEWLLRLRVVLLWVLVQLFLSILQLLFELVDLRQLAEIEELIDYLLMILSILFLFMELVLEHRIIFT